MSPTQRTLKLLREQGYKSAVVERWLRYAGQFGKRQDMFGIIDVLAINSEGDLGIQCCAGSVQSHLTKLLEEKNQECYDWLSCPHRRLEIWGWRKLLKKRGGKVKYWAPNIVEIVLEDLDRLPQ